MAADAAMASVPLVIVAAKARNRVIGDGGPLLWRLPSDLRHFKALTLGKPLIMGRRTFESIGKPLPGRETIVLTRDAGFRAPGVHAARSLEAALELGRERALAMGTDALIIAGGGDLYAQTIGRADRLELTEVDLAAVGRTVFPAIDPAIWRESARRAHPPGPGDAAGFSFVTLVRCDRSAAPG